MKSKAKKRSLKHKVKYTDDMGEMDDFDQSHILTMKEQRALGIPSIEEVEKMPIVVRKTPKDARMNVRLGTDVLEGLKFRAAQLGMPYQTLAASVLHMVAHGEIRLAFLEKSASKRQRA